MWFFLYKIVWVRMGIEVVVVYIICKFVVIRSMCKIVFIVYIYVKFRVVVLLNWFVDFEDI